MSGLFQEIRSSIGSKGTTFVEDEDSEEDGFRRRWIKQGWRKSQICFQTSYPNRGKLTFNLELQLDIETRTGARSVTRFRRL